MIAATTRISIEWIPTELIDFTVPPVLSPRHIKRYVDLMAPGGVDNGMHLDPPMLEKREDGRYFVWNGRHRILAHMAIGRTHVRCVIVHQPESAGSLESSGPPSVRQ